MQPLTILIHGDWGVGKSWFGQTAPAPRLVLDAEGGSQFTYGRKVTWENPNNPPPEHDGSWDTCIVNVRDLKTLQTVWTWLSRGKHPFVSVILDSLSELQKRIVDDVAGTSQLRPQDWGAVFRQGESLVRSFRDLKYNVNRPIPCVVYLSGTVERGEETIKLSPYVQGQLGKTLPGFVDIVGLLVIGEDEDQRLLRVKPSAGFTAKDRTHTFRDGVVDVTFTDERGWTNTIESMQQQIAASLEARTTAATAAEKESA